MAAESVEILDEKVKQAYAWYMEEENPEKAAELVQNAAQAGHLRAISLLGSFYRDGFGVPVDVNKAEYQFRRAADLGWARAMSNLAGLLDQKATSEDRSESLAWYDKAIAADPSDPVAYHDAGYMMMGRNPQIARDYFQRGLQVAPEDPSLYFNLGVTMESLRNPKAAQECYEKAVAKGDDSNDLGHWARINLGMVHKRQGRFDEARAQFQVVLDHHPDSQTANFNMANVMQCLEDHSAAKRYFERSLELDPEHLSSHFNLAVTLGELQDFHASERHYQKALELCDTDAEIHFGYAVLLHRDLELLKKARPHYERALELRPDHPQARSFLLILLDSIDPKAKLNYMMVNNPVVSDEDEDE